MKNFLAIVLVCIAATVFASRFKNIKCRDCKGLGHVWQTQTCDHCNGKGYTGYTYTSERVVRCPKCSKGILTNTTINGKNVQIGKGQIKTKVDCEACAGRGSVKNPNYNDPDGDSGIKTLSVTKEQWEKVCEILESKGEIFLKKSGIKIKILDAKSEGDLNL